MINLDHKYYNLKIDSSRNSWSVIYPNFVYPPFSVAVRRKRLNQYNKLEMQSHPAQGDRQTSGPPYCPHFGWIVFSFEIKSFLCSALMVMAGRKGPWGKVNSVSTIGQVHDWVWGLTDISLLCVLVQVRKQANNRFVITSWIFDYEF